MAADFDRAAAESGFALDGAQRAVVQRLERLGSEVVTRGRFGAPPRGVYLWGPVGRGKSWLTSTFFEALDEKRKYRVHFHDFFRQFHQAYARNPGRGAVDRAVDVLLGRVRFLYFDEFHVHDPGDAMLIGRLFRTLFDRGTVLLATSNYAPDQLLPNPLYHHLFEPTITRLTEHLDVVELAGDTDYRGVKVGGARTAFETGCYLSPGSPEQLRRAGVRPPERTEVSLLTINGRRIRALAAREGLVWFDFHDLCAETTAAPDYLALAEVYPTWVISGLPVLDDASRDPAQRFGNVIDVLCDRDIRLVLIGEAAPADVLGSASLPLDPARMMSRLSLLAINP